MNSAVTYVITEGQLVTLHHGRPEFAVPCDAVEDMAEALRAIRETQWVGDFTAVDLKLACQRMTMLARSALAKAGL